MIRKGFDIYYFIEQKKYTPADGDTYTFINTIVRRNIRDSGILQHTNGAFSFSFVGLITFGDYILSVLPKYVSDKLSEEVYRNNTVHQIQVLQKYVGSNVQLEGADFFAASAYDEDFSEPVLAEAIIDYYIRYGIWSKQEKYAVVGGSGGTDWSRTVELTQPVITGHSVFYPQTYNYSNRIQNTQIITRIHQWATSYCIRKYSDILPGYGGIFYEGDAPESSDEIAEAEILIAALERELNQTYIDVNIMLLINLLWLIRKKNLRSNEPQITFYGTTSFHNVWEAACKKAFNDMSGHKKLKGLFKPPLWIEKRDNGIKFKAADTDKTNKKNRLIPDVVWFDDVADDKKLLVMDAKYYNIKFENAVVRDNPGIADISKQILYQQVLQNDPDSPVQGCDKTINAFVFPRTDIQSEMYGAGDSAADWIWGHINSNITGWENRPIFVLLIPPDKILQSFLSDQPVPEWQSLFNELLKIREEIQ